jgi:hypothetical protein
LLAAHGESSNFSRIGLETALIGKFRTAPRMPLLQNRSSFMFRSARRDCAGINCADASRRSDSQAAQLADR